MRKMLLWALLFFTSNLAFAEKLQTMHFTNRAQCAIESNTPAESVYLLLNNMDVARSVYRLAKARGEDSTALTKLGIQVYRYSIIELINLIHKKLVSGKLPLLPADASDTNVPMKYRQAMESCVGGTACPALDLYLQNLWQSSNVESVDNFTDAQFINSNKNQIVPIKCSYLKKFSPLEAQLYGSKPNVEMFNKLGQAVDKVEEYLADCSDFNSQENIRIASYSIKIDGIDKKEWTNKGFDYWNSLKLYLSWGFRNAPEMKQLASPFYQLFKAVSIEDSLIMTPDNCRSIVQPKCDSEYLNTNAIREFAKSDYKKRLDELDFLDSIPEGSQLQMLNDPFTEVNKDILGFKDYETSSAWANNLRENLSGTRTIIRGQLLQSISFLDVLSKKVTPERIEAHIKKHFAPLFANFDANNSLKNELYYLCAEYTFATDEEISLIKNKLNMLGKINLLDGVMGEIVNNSSEDFFNYFQNTALSVRNYCKSFDQEKMFNSSFELDKSGFNKWYIEKAYDNSLVSSAEKKSSDYLKTHPPLLSYKNYQTTKSQYDIVCANGPECARKILKSIISLYAATQYADTFWSLDQKIKTPDLFNPYAERNVCKIYDPWFKTKATLFSAFTDFIQGAVSTVAPGAVYGNFDLQPGRVVSFNQLASEGKIKFDARYSKAKVQAGLAVNFGSLLGVPCGVSVAKSEITNPYQALRFNGISVRACRSNEKNVITVNSPSDITTSDPKGLSSCFVCALNFEQVGNSAAKFVPFGQTSFFLVRGLVKLYKGFKDPLNIPHSWSVNPELVNMSYNAFLKNIPEGCVSKLSKGKACMPNSCEEEIATLMNEKTNNSKVVSINSENTFKGYAEVKLSGCSTPIRLKANYYQSNTDNGQSSDFRCNPKLVSLPPGCSL